MQSTFVIDHSLPGNKNKRDYKNCFLHPVLITNQSNLSENCISLYAIKQCLYSTYVIMKL